MSYGLPFKRGWYMPSNADGGAVPSNILGQTYLDPNDGNLLQIVKNTDGSALAGCHLVKWEDASNYEVDYATDSGTVQVAGVVDPAYANRGVTVPINAAFMVVKRGRTHCIADEVVSSNAVLIGGPTDGQVQNGIAGDSPVATFGVSYASGNAGDSVLSFVNIP